MQHRTIEAEVHELAGRLIVIKSDELDHSSMEAIRQSFRKRGVEIIGIMGLGSEDSLETISKEDAIKILNQIINKPESA